MIELIDAKRTALETIIERKASIQPDVSSAVVSIITDVRTRGDAALREYTLRFDEAEIGEFKVSGDEIRSALADTPPEFIAILESAADNIRRYHSRQLREGYEMKESGGIVMGQRVMPLDRVGVYIPGGTAPYPSTVLMNVIPAKLAGVGEVFITTPPDRDGVVDKAILAAASIAGADEIYKIGGAQAIAALTYGTESIPKVDKIVGPGNIYVAAAKKHVFGEVGIDMIAGPSDILIIADETACPAFVAADLLSQAEHDENSAVVLITPCAALAEKVRAELEKQIVSLERRGVAEAAVRRNGRFILAEDLNHAAELSNALAPEHVELCVSDPFALLERIRHAGSVFLGHHTPEALGDYCAGPNHTLPTLGAARFSSPLSVDDFIKKSSYLSYSREAFAAAAPTVTAFAEKEGLTGHANSIRIRMGGMI